MNATADLLDLQDSRRREIILRFERHSSMARNEGEAGEDRGSRREPPAFEKDPETAINYRLISHNYQANQTPGMPRQRVSTEVYTYT